MLGKTTNDLSQKPLAVLAILGVEISPIQRETLTYLMTHPSSSNVSTEQNFHLSLLTLSRKQEAMLKEELRFRWQFLNRSEPTEPLSA